MRLCVFEIGCDLSWPAGGSLSTLNQHYNQEVKTGDQCENDIWIYICEFAD